MNHLSRDARFGVRMLWRNSGFTAVAVLALALGIAANTAIFTLWIGTWFWTQFMRSAMR